MSAITALDLRFSVYFLRYFVLKGYAAGPYHDQAGGGSNFLCLPEVPQWKNYMSSHEPSGTIVGVEYEFHPMGPNKNDIFNEVNGAHSDRLGVCAFCYVQGRSTVAMIQHEHSVPMAGPSSTQDISLQLIHTPPAAIVAAAICVGARIWKLLFSAE